MSRPYSMDLRERVVAAYQRGDVTMKEVADQFGVGVATVNRWLRWTRERGSPAPLPPGRGPKPLIGEEEWPMVEQILVERPDATMQEVAWELDERFGFEVSRSTVQKAVQSRGWTRKKRVSAPKSRT